MFEKINFEADDPVFLASLVGGIGTALAIDDYVVGVVIAGIGLAVLSYVENDTVVKAAYGFLLGFVSTLLVKGVSRALSSAGIGLSIPNEIGVLG